MTKDNLPPASGWASELAAGSPRSFTELKELEYTAEAIIAAQSGGGSEAPDLVATSIDADKVWANYNRGAATPLKPSAKVSREEVAARINGGGK